jgi:hypothetical protein
MVHDFLSHLRADIEALERTKDDLNLALRGSVFMGEVYQIRQERDQDKSSCSRNTRSACRSERRWMMRMIVGELTNQRAPRI